MNSNKFTIKFSKANTISDNFETFESVSHNYTNFDVVLFKLVKLDFNLIFFLIFNVFSVHFVK